MLPSSLLLNLHVLGVERDHCGEANFWIEVSPLVRRIGDIAGDMKTGVSIIIPTRDEQDNIDPLFRRLQSMQVAEHYCYEIIVVDDSSADDTRQRVRGWFDRLPVSLVCRDHDGCLAGAVIAGARAAHYRWVVVMDADLSHPPEAIFDLLAPLSAGECDMVIGSRYVAGGATPHWPARRRFASFAASLPARLFTDVKDPMAGFFATPTRRLQQLRDDVPGFKIGLEVLAAGGADMRVVEIPIIFQDRFEGFSKMNKRVVLDYGKQLLQLCGISPRLFRPSSLAGVVGVAALAGWLVFAGIYLIGGGAVAALFGVVLATGGMVVTMMCRWVAPDGGAGGAVKRYRIIMAVGALGLSFAMQEAGFALLSPVLGVLLSAAALSVLSAVVLYVLAAIFVCSALAERERRPRLRAAAAAVILMVVALASSLVVSG